MRAIIDTNVLLSGLLWHGTPHALLDRVRDGTLTLVSSPVLLAELAEVLEQPKFDAVLARSSTSRERSLAEIQQLAEVLVPEALPQPVCRDPDDDHVLALALTAQVDLIVSGDKDLLDLNSFEKHPDRHASRCIAYHRSSEVARPLRLTTELLLQNDLPIGLIRQLGNPEFVLRLPIRNSPNLDTLTSRSVFDCVAKRTAPRIEGYSHEKLFVTAATTTRMNQFLQVCGIATVLLVE